MRMNSSLATGTRKALIGALFAMPLATVHAQGVPIDDEELAGVWGQAMFSVDNTTLPSYDLTKITLNADVKLNADFYNMQLGKVGTNPAAVDIGELHFVSGLAGENYVSIKDPYLQFVYKKQASTTLTDREIVGLRFGFGEISGNLGVKFNSLAGQMTLADGVGATNGGKGKLTLNSATTTSNFQSASGPVAMNMVGQVQANKSTDFFISLLTEGVSYGDGTSAAAGLSINWNSNLSYMNLSGVVMQNPLPPLSVRQGG
ncbi:MAG: hypothetical protein KGN37_10045 [Burkholderiales bacterium]|nr:hypothetical protein [Burkholderiales bacterium]MDE2433174.1 hypothetical protein [Burkholderiales bacterium]